MKRKLTHAVRALIRRRWKPADMPACRAQMAAAAAALDDNAPGLQGADALALREQLRVDAGRRMQAALPLVCAPVPCAGVEAARAAGSVGMGGYASRSGSPVDGSSLGAPVAGNSDPVSCVDSGRGSY
ncbi:hypothetical protein STPYR_12769 [uncultured Stenotrophomonas sp.]|uniref:Uncharacterized protein n=1 Tax=uncultured Stenotrophomonas sp. TaxID=165438 RepID=A0A1Y5Q915_9GAMM|nr:hypothetical protein STPYR_12769 [uncultured Stenotrophomonas sp.]